MSYRILQGSVFDRLPEIEPGSIDVAVTSPPYWGLRSYLPAGHPLKASELGLEQSPRDYVASIVKVLSLVRKCLADHGTLWLNIGDTYATGAGAVGECPGGGEQGERWKQHWEATHHMPQTPDKKNPGAGVPMFQPNRMPIDGIAATNLCLIPQRLMIALQDAGWIVRSLIVWHKPAPMPASVTGWMWRRCRVKVKGHDYSTVSQPSKTAALSKALSRDAGSNGEWIGGATWADCPGCKKCSKTDGLVLRRGSWRPTSSWEPVIMLAKTADYYCDGEAVKQPAAPATLSRDQYTRVLDDPDEQFAVRHDHETVSDGGANLRDVWTISSEPLGEKHYAAYPTELVRRCLQAGTSQRGYCSACGAPWTRCVERTREHGLANDAYGKTNAIEDDQHAHKRIHRRMRAARAAGESHDNPLGGYKTTGWRPSCRCVDAGEPRPGRVLDPFCGSGRTGITAGRLGLDFVGVELNPEYVAMATRLLRADMPLFAQSGGAT